MGKTRKRKGKAEKNMRKGKICYLLAASLTLSLACGCTKAATKDAAKRAENTVQEISDQAENIFDSDDEHVLGVKNGHPVTYPDICYGDAFDNFFGTPTWKYFQADTGEDVVEFTGYCTYHDVEVKARLQFILETDGTITYGAMSFNDVPQTQIITATMVETAFDTYMENKGITADAKADASDNDSQAAVPDTAPEADNQTPASNTTSDTDTSDTDNTNTKPDMASLEGDYTRTHAPTCALSVWSANEEGINFSMAIGASGYRAYVDFRDRTAVWTDNSTAVYTEGDYQIELKVDDDGILTFKENQPYNADFPLSGSFLKNDLIEDSSEFIFPEDDVFPINASDLEGKNAMECKIARNEIFARHGRRFSDEGLQGYFDTCIWYEGTTNPENFSEDVLNEIEKANLQTISDYEARMGFN